MLCCLPGFGSKRHARVSTRKRHGCGAQDISRGDESYAAGVARLAGSPGPVVDAHLALLQANVRRTAVVASLHAAESCVRWDALRCCAHLLCSVVSRSHVCAQGRASKRTGRLAPR